MKPRHVFLKSLRREKTPRASVGSATSIATADLMDELGVSFPQAHLDAEKMTTLAAAGATKLGFDNVMPLFSVWHESAALGCKVDWGDNLHMPGCRQPLCASINDEFNIPADLLTRGPCAVPLQSLSLLQKRLGSEIAVVGKAFGPWTLGYHVYGVQEFLIATALDPDAVKRAMHNLLPVTIQFCDAQIAAGADAITLADHCTRDLCSSAAYQTFLQEVHQELHERIACPLILHTCGDTSDRLPMIRRTGIECFHFDSKVPTPDARRLAGRRMALMGGTSNIAIVKNGTPQAISEDVAEKIANNIDIIGPECAVPLDAPFENLKLIAQEAKRLSTGG